VLIMTALHPSFLCHCTGLSRELCGSRDAIAIPETERRCVRVKTYEVRVFVPTVFAIEARDEQEALAKVVELYKKLLAKDVRTWIEPLPEPEDM
jgi:hypothetical protein